MVLHFPAALHQSLIGFCFIWNLSLQAGHAFRRSNTPSDGAASPEKARP
jgi:hypothetical protein